MVDRMQAGNVFRTLWHTWIIRLAQHVPAHGLDQVVEAVLRDALRQALGGLLHSLMVPGTPVWPVRHVADGEAQ